MKNDGYTCPMAQNSGAIAGTARSVDGSDIQNNQLGYIKPCK